MTFEDTIRKILREELRALLHEIKVDDRVEPNGDKLLTRPEAAAYLGVKLQTLDNWERSGKVKSRRIGRRVRYFESDLKNSLK